MRSLGFETFLIRADIPLGCSRLGYYKLLLQKGGFISLVCYFKSLLFSKIAGKILSENKNNDKRKFSVFVDINLNSTKIFRSLSEFDFISCREKSGIEIMKYIREKSMERCNIFIKFNEFQKNLENVKYKNSVVGILDILGFKNKIEKGDEKFLQEINKVILEGKF